jgi:NAD(P)-dependent dehydrogenase (short-subunit alcohol dehydrogenase family)
VSAIEELFGLRGRVAVVTGASSGLGAEMAEALASAGADVALLARRTELLETRALSLAATHRVRVLAVATDLTDRAATAAAFARVDGELGAIDVLVNNAGVAPTGKAETQWPDAWDETLALNLSAVFHCCVLAAPGMRRRGFGRIINVSSIFGHLGSSLFRVSSYAATKGGVENLTRQLAVEWARDGITVNAIAPAWFPSEMTAGSLSKEAIVAKMGAGAPLQRMGRPGELKTACLFLASPASSYVTGAIVPVDGGYSAW